MNLFFARDRVSSFYLDDNKLWAMLQSRGRTDDVEHAFSHQRGKNSNPTIWDCNQLLGRDAGVKRTTFSLKIKSNTSGDKFVYLNELKQLLSNKRKFDEDN